MMTNEQIAGLAALLTDATPGPWQSHGSHFYGPDPDSVLIGNMWRGGPFDANLALIARAPDLAAEVLRLTAALEHWRHEVGKLHSQVDRLKHDRDAGAKDYCALMERHDALSTTVADLTAELAKTRRDLETANYQVDRLLALSNSMDDDFQAEIAKLSDPVAVHANMLVGKIALPTVDQIIHLYGRDVLARALGAKS